LNVEISKETYDRVMNYKGDFDTTENATFEQMLNHFMDAIDSEW